MPPSPSELRALEDRVGAKFSRWVKRHGFLDEEGPSQGELDGWWAAAANEPSGVLGGSGGGAKSASFTGVEPRGGGEWDGTILDEHDAGRQVRGESSPQSSSRVSSR